MKKMKNIQSFVLLILLSGTISCEKAKEIANQQAEDIVVTLMTNGRWLVDQFSVSGINQKAEFDGYEFQFLKDGTVDAIKGSTTTKGTWKGNQTVLTLESNFANGNDTLKKLNYTWYIAKSDASSVEAKVIQTGYVSNIRLVKK